MSKLRVMLISFLIVLTAVFMAEAQELYLNEFSASNATIIIDTEFNDYSDWIEIYNAGAVQIDLNGYFLTDNLNNPTKWQFTVSTLIDAGEHLIVWMDGKDTESHPAFKLSQDGESLGLVSPAGVWLDSVTFTSQQVDVSFGRKTDGAAEWAYFNEPTPGNSNTSPAYFGFVQNVVDFSICGGFYSSSISIELSSVMEGDIRFTLDGSEPSQNSTLYSAPIDIASTTILRARVIQPGLIPGQIVTHSYFLNENSEYKKLPVVSIASDPDNFWGAEQGIYVQDFKPEWEVPINIELFENNGSNRAAFNLSAGTKVNGLNSWELPQKMLGIYFRKQYGVGKLEYPLFFDKNRTNFENFALRASGSDWSYTLFRDILGQHASQLNMDIDIMAFRPCIVFVNGEYMGIHNIREKVNEDYIVGNYGLDPGSFDMVENEDFAEEGDLIAYQNLKQLLDKDLAVQSNFDAVANAIDIENFTDYVATQMMVRNTSINHNVMAWKQKDSGKWKWVMMDLDRGFFTPSTRLISFYTDQNVLPLDDLMANEEYSIYFGKRLADHLYTGFHSERMKALINEHQFLIEHEIERHVERWDGATSDYGNAIPSANAWYNNISDVRNFVQTRPQILLNDLQNYGFSASTSLSLTTYPQKAGFISLNGFRVPANNWTGQYPANLEIEIEAHEKPGYNFVAWTSANTKILIAKKSSWKYLDNGTDQGTAWQTLAFDDSGWSIGNAQLGYGDGDENTLLSYGGNANSKYLTYYFRKTIELTTDELQNGSFGLSILRDDGAIVYVNGQEAVRSNMPEGSVSSETLANNSVASGEETGFFYYPLSASLFTTGNNSIAVEVHQSSANSSDISFDLELFLEMASSKNIISTEKNYVFTLTGPMSYSATYEASGDCILPDTISADMSLNSNCSPYYAQADVLIEAGVKLTIEPGVEILMSEYSNILVHGEVEANGTATQPIRIALNPQYTGQNWGALCFIDSPDTSRLSHVIVENASHGPGNISAIGAISSFQANVEMDYLLIENVARNPITARFSSIVLRNSRLHSEVTGDLINVKYGTAHIDNCEFRGNTMPDTDAIDYDNITDGVIRNCKIFNFYGSNSDGIDIGERAVNIRIDSNIIYNITDKGISVGQHSTAKVSNTVFVNCSMGLGLKDSCRVSIDQCTFYNVGTPVASFEKNAGSAGGNGWLTNSIFSNSTSQSYLVDSRSTLEIAKSLSDTDILPEGKGNIFSNPLFIDPTHFDFRLASTSLGKNFSGNSDLGSHFHNFEGEVSVMISGIYYNTMNEFSHSEFLILQNPSAESIDISGYQLSNAISFTFPEGTILSQYGTVFLAKNLSNPPPQYYPALSFEWSQGKLANEGETILLTDNFGIVRDKVVYSPEYPWPVVTSAGDVLVLSSNSVDNHFGENWLLKNYYEIIHVQHDEADVPLSVYPNPASNVIHIQATGHSNETIRIYNLSGRLLLQANLNQNGYATLETRYLSSGMYIIRVGGESMKLIIVNP